MPDMERIVPSSKMPAKALGSAAQPVFPGYPAIEALMQTGDFRALNTSFREMYDKLDHVSAHAKGFGKAGQAKKALAGLELTVDLLRQLVQMKQTLDAKAKQNRGTGASAGRKI